MIRTQQIEAKTFAALIRFRRFQARSAREFKLVLFLTLLHLLLGVGIYYAGPLALLHPIGAFAVGLAWALRSDVPMSRVSLATGYIIGSEVLWRMAQIPVFWEFGKYSCVVIMVVALIRRSNIRIPVLPLVYFAALLPSSVLTLVALDWSRGHEALSSNLSGPFALAVSCLFFANTKLSLLELRRVCLAIALPLIGVACATLFFTASVENIQFTQESNFVTSGGFGPNQVSAMLGLGAFLTLLCLIVFKNRNRDKVYFAAAALLCTAQSVMTFSRGGIYNALLAISVVFLWEFRRPAEAWKRLAPVVVAAVFFVALIFPALNNFTGGSLQERFEDTATSRRGDIADADLQIFYDQPVLGVGIGMATDYRARFLGYKGMSHTEFSRLLSEHGLFGVLALLSLVAMAIANIYGQPSMAGRAAVIGAAAWCVFFMMNTGMRLAAPAVVWGLTFATVISSTQRRRLLGADPRVPKTSGTNQ
jgi:hypothetical protein